MVTSLEQLRSRRQLPPRPGGHAVGLGLVGAGAGDRANTPAQNRQPENARNRAPQA